MNKNLASVIGAIGASIFFSVLPIYAQPFIYVKVVTSFSSRARRNTMATQMVPYGMERIWF